MPQAGREKARRLADFQVASCDGVGSALTPVMTARSGIRPVTSARKGVTRLTSRLGFDRNDAGSNFVVRKREMLFLVIRTFRFSHVPARHGLFS
jgi:hypothetical protein